MQKLEADAQKLSIHILIIWSNGDSKRKEILDDLRNSFEVIQTFKVHWDNSSFLKNLMVFYAHSQKNLSKASLKVLMKGKKKHCGGQDFYVVVFKDCSPLYENRETSSGVRLVNTHVFDKKQLYRSWTGGGHKIHCSNDRWETNKDLTLLFGLNTDDFCKKYGCDTHERSFEEEFISHNCIGVGGYKDIQQFFYVLNNAIDYVVLRNHECLPEQYTIEGHGDIDLLVEHKNYMVHLTNAIPIKHLRYRVCYNVSIGGVLVPFDFRYLGDNYYDSLWERNILKTRVYQERGFYTPNIENQFYSLLYHAYVQKPEVRDDYIPKLITYGETAGINFVPSVEQGMSLIDSFFEKYTYEYIRPNDISVYYNEENLAKSHRAFRFGRCLKRIDENSGDSMHYHSALFEKEYSYVKYGSSWLIDNEAHYLNLLKESGLVPKIIKHECLDNVHGSMIEIEKMPGYNMEEMMNHATFYTPSNIRYFIKNSISALVCLKEHNIAHRDFRLPNLILKVEENEKAFAIIDFGWSCDLHDISKHRPLTLTQFYARSVNDTDFVIFARVIQKHWGRFEYMRRISTKLESITIGVIDDKTLFEAKIHELNAEIEKTFGLRDCALFLCYRWEINKIYKKYKTIKEDPCYYYGFLKEKFHGFIRRVKSKMWHIVRKPV